MGFAAPASAQSAVLTPLDQAPPSFVDVRTAVAVTPNGSTRWNELSLPANGRALWLVPVRPGAAVDWAARRWLDALDEATTPRIVPPSSSTTCPTRTSPEAVRGWTFAATHELVADPTVALSADAVVSYANARGYRVSTAFIDALGRIYADGWRVAMVDAHGDAMGTTFGTLRVTDDAGPVLPLSLASGLPTALRMTTFTIGPGRTSIASLGVADVDRFALTWGTLGSNYVSWRNDVITAAGGSSWLRESSSHDVVFDGVPLGVDRTHSVAEAYFVNASCTQLAIARGSSSRPAAPDAFSCGEERDLALAVSTSIPAGVVIGRWAGTIPAGSLGTNVALAFDGATSHGPVFRASSYEPCAVPETGGSHGGSGSSSGGGPSYGGSGSSSGGGVVPVYVDSEGCGGSSSEPVVTDDPPASASEGCGSSDSSSSSSSSESSTEGWDDDDSDSDDSDDSHSDDSCSKKHDSSSSSDSCSGSSTSTGGGGDSDGWDTEDGMAPKTHKPHAFHKPARKRSSPVSRIALLGVALILPFRRRGRPT